MTFRILSLSGGGIRGVYQAVFLKKLSAQLPQPLKSNFDIIAGTSTGALLAAAIAMDIDPAQILSLYRAEGPKIFARRVASGVRSGPHYEQEPLKVALEKVFGNASLRDIKTPLLVVPATTLGKFGPRVFWNYVSESPKNGDLDLKVVDALLASAAAPTFFEPVQPMGQDRTYVDGGLWANSPCLVSAIYAHMYLEVDFRDMRVLAIGNGSTEQAIWGDELKTRNPWSIQSVKDIIEMMFETQAHCAENMARYLVGKDNFLKVDDDPGKVVHLDDVETALQVLPRLAEARANQNMSMVLDFLNPLVEAKAPPKSTVERHVEGKGAPILPPTVPIPDPIPEPIKKRAPDRAEAEIISIGDGGETFALDTTRETIELIANGQRIPVTVWIGGPDLGKAWKKPSADGMVVKLGGSGGRSFKTSDSYTFSEFNLSKILGGGWDKGGGFGGGGFPK